VGLLVKLTAVAAMLGCLATAVLDLQAVQLGGDELRRGRSPALVAAITENNRLAGLAVKATVGVILVHLVMSIVWYSRRRPRVIRERAGEAYVESPLPLTGSSWLRRSFRAVALATCVLFAMSQLSGTATVPQRVERARYSALTYLVVAAAMALRAACWADVERPRSHGARGPACASLAREFSPPR
jgi:hypothetical protein